MIQSLSQLTRSTQINIQLFKHMHRQPNGTGLIHQSPLNGLPDPPGGIGRESVTQFRVKFFNGSHQTQIALLDQIQKFKATIDIASGDFNYQPQIAFNHPMPRRFTSSL